jgi:outer membrane lipoprotein-sorting protein
MQTSIGGLVASLAEAKDETAPGAKSRKEMGMRKKEIVCLTAVGAILGWLFLCHASAEKDQSSDTVFQDEPAAHALYDKMIETMRKAQSLSYESDYSFGREDTKGQQCTYRIWMQKPNYFRVETVSKKGEKGGILIGDGDYLWIYWPNGRPRWHYEDFETHKKTSSEVYMKKRTPIGRHSIGHEVCELGAGMSMPIIDPSTFHGYTDSLQRYIEGVRGLGTEKVGDEKCDVIEVSIMKGQRRWYLWLSRKDHLPRKLKQRIRTSQDDIVTDETWSKVTLDAAIPTQKFAWKPPEGWKVWRKPSSQERLLKAGQQAPDFELLSADGSKIKLSDYRNKVVWLYIWRAG